MDAKIKADLIALHDLIIPARVDWKVIDYLRMAVDKGGMSFGEYCDIYQELHKIGIGTNINMLDLLRAIDPPKRPVGFKGNHFQ